MTFPAKTDERDEFFCYLHGFATRYQLSNVELAKLPNGLWCAMDGHCHRLNDQGLWIGRPDKEHVPQWVADTSHAFRDLWGLLEAQGAASEARLYRLPPEPPSQPVDTASSAAPVEAAPEPIPSSPEPPKEAL